MDYLQKHKDTLVPEFRQVWEAAGSKTSGTWEEVFGQSKVTDGIFHGLNYARYIGRVAEAGKAEYPLPMFVNAALYGIGEVPTPSERWPPLGLGHGRLESRGAANRYALARLIQRERLCGVLRQVQPAREPAIHPENMADRTRGQSALRLRTA